MKKSPDKKKTNYFIIIVIAAIIFVVFGYLNAFKHTDNIKKNMCNSFGRITRYESLYKSSRGYYYEFYSGNKTYTGFYSHGFDNLPIINKIFPVVFDCNDVDNNALLVLPTDFERNGKVFPDSLNWLKQYDN